MGCARSDPGGSVSEARVGPARVSGRGQDMVSEREVVGSSPPAFGGGARARCPPPCSPAARCRRAPRLRVHHPLQLLRAGGRGVRGGGLDGVAGGGRDGRAPGMGGVSAGGGVERRARGASRLLRWAVRLQTADCLQSFVNGTPPRRCNLGRCHPRPACAQALRKALASMPAPPIPHRAFSNAESSDRAKHAQATCSSNGTRSMSPSRLRAWAMS